MKDRVAHSGDERNRAEEEHRDDDGGADAPNVLRRRALDAPRALAEKLDCAVDGAQEEQRLHTGTRAAFETIRGDTQMQKYRAVKETTAAKGLILSRVTCFSVMKFCV